jgi:hypothetical protein
MSNDLKLGNLNVFQLGYVYKDIEKQAKIMESVFGVSKFTMVGPLILRINYRGVKAKITVRAAFAQYSETQLELIQLIEGDSIYKEFLDQGREGFHHVLYKVDDLKAVINKYKENGIEVIQSGRIMSSSYAYMDTEKKLGIIFEFAKS